MGVNDNLLQLIVIYMLSAVVVSWASSSSKKPSAGLASAYVMNFSMNHLFGAAIYLFPWYVTDDSEFVRIGFEESTIGIASFAAGCLLLSPWLVSMAASSWKRLPPRIPDSRLPVTYIATGFIFYFFLLPVIRSIPSVGLLGFSGLSLMIVGICLASWSAWSKKGRRIIRWVLLGLALPLITVVQGGFLGYGISALCLILSFIGVFYRPKWKLVLIGSLSVYMGLSLFVTYFRDRTEYREATWNENISYSQRFEKVFKTLSDFEFFDVRNEQHLLRIDSRLNQNVLVGQAVNYISHGHETFAKGKTLIEALVSLVPRILWPDKPVTAGSGNYVGQYTGVEYNESTSVGLGQVLEFYINFGRTCVIIGFFILGGITGFIDKGAGDRLARGDWKGFVFWFLPGLSLMQSGGSLVEVVSTFAASVVFCILINKYIITRMSGRLISWRRFLRLLPGRRSA